MTNEDCEECQGTGEVESGVYEFEKVSPVKLFDGTFEEVLAKLTNKMKVN